MTYDRRVMNHRNFWQEFLRVQTDKILLCSLLLIMHYWRTSGEMQAAVIGGLIGVIQSQRFSREDKRGSPNIKDETRNL
jgi:hypothetical protein